MFSMPIMRTVWRRELEVLNRHVCINVILVTRDDAWGVLACASVGKGVKTKPTVMLLHIPI